MQLDKASSLDELFGLVWRKVDPETGKNREEEQQLNQMKQYRAKMK